tara:strand:+ start:1435 stop:1731 length:297 start_codon:yes stop_codon:yes gene_type:complete
MIFAYSINDIDNVLIDPWSGIHAISGIILSNINISNSSNFYVAILWEIIENSRLGPILWNIIGFDNYEGDAYINIISDIKLLKSISRIINIFIIKIIC